MARRNTGEQPASAVTMHEQRPRARRSSAKKKAQEDEAYAQDSRKVQKYATQGLRQRQALEEVNDFSPLDPESEEDDVTNGDDNEPSATDSFTFTSVPLRGMTNQSRVRTNATPTTRTSVGHAGQENNQDSYIPPRLTPRTHHVPPSFTSTYSKTPVAPLPSTVMDPQLLTGGFEENSHVDIPSKYVQQSRFEQRFATVPHHMDGQVEHHTPTPFRGVPLELDGQQFFKFDRVPSDATALGAGKRLAPPLTEVNGLQVVQKVKLGDGGSQGRVRCADFDGLYSSIIHLAVGHYQAILANSTIYPGDIESRNWSGEAWAAACRANGVKIDYDEDTYKLVLAPICGAELKTVMRPLVVTEFRFIDEKTPEAIKSNAALAESLLANRKNFTYKDRKEAKGAFEADVIQKGMIKWCYEKKNSLGIKFPTYFVDTNTGGASFGIIVAILTAIEACVMEWTTGMRIETKFYKEQYAMVFDSYLQLLGRFHEGTKHADIVPRICKKFLKVARRHANVPNEPVANTFMQHFTVDEFAAAAAEWDTRNGSDSDNDMM
ncbi:hypothetical protein DFH29DRAFT_879887 [Suillus ampliporus]|nr:hypothetical protein DFH29DRAFT_879887 [Suillus ampliporus]